MPGAPRGERGLGRSGRRDRRSSKLCGEANPGDRGPRRTAAKRPGTVRGSVGPLLSSGVTVRLARGVADLTVAASLRQFRQATKPKTTSAPTSNSTSKAVKRASATGGASRTSSGAAGTSGTNNLSRKLSAACAASSLSFEAPASFFGPRRTTRARVRPRPCCSFPRCGASLATTRRAIGPSGGGIRRRDRTCSAGTVASVQFTGQMFMKPNIKNPSR